jgi:predicted permease
MNIFTADLALAISRLALLIALGWFLAHRGWVGSHARQPLMRLVVWVFFPAMIFDRVCGNALIRSGGATLLYLGVGFGMIVGGIFVGRLAAAALRFPEGNARRTFSYSAGINNFGYLGIPVTAALFDRDVVGVLMVHNVGVEAAVWTFGVAFLTGGSGFKGLKNLVQPIPVALAVALLVNFAGWGETAPARFAAQLCHVVGECAIPVGTILTGIFLHEALKGFRFFAEPRISLGILLVRGVVIPVLLLCVASMLIADPALRKVMMVQAAMPAGIFSFLIVEMYHGDVQVALRCSVLTMVLCPLVTPLWLHLGSRWLGLAA